MRKALSFLGFLLLCASFLAVSSYAQQRIIRTHTDQYVNGKIDLTDYKINEKYVTFDYKLTFEGMVEVKVYDGQHHLVWENQKLNTEGSNCLRLNSSAFHKGEHYTVVLDYKLEEITKDILIPRT